VRTRLLAASMLVLFVAVTLCCKSIFPNHNPTITSMGGPTAVTAGDENEYLCIATDPDRDELSYTWSCNSGTLSSTSSKTVYWTAPNQSGTANLQVTVRDSRGGSDTQTKSVNVAARTTTVIDWDGAVQAGYYIYWAKDIASGYRVSGDFSVDAYDITLLILSASNYENWRNNQSYNYVVQVSRSAGANFSATIGTTGTYYIILDNTYSMITDKFAHLFVQTTSP